MDGISPALKGKCCVANRIRKTRRVNGSLTTCGNKAARSLWVSTPFGRRVFLPITEHPCERNGRATVQALSGHYGASRTHLRGFQGTAANTDSFDVLSPTRACRDSVIYLALASPSRFAHGAESMTQDQGEA